MQWLIARAEQHTQAENTRIRRDLVELRDEVAQLESRLQVAELEQQLLLDVIERNRRRVQAETQVAAATIAEHENGTGQDTSRPNHRIAHAS